MPKLIQQDQETNRFIKGLMTMFRLKAFAAVAAAFLLSSLISQTALAAAQEKEWTMLVFINGHNNLDHFGKKDINEMEQVGSTDQVNVVVQWASLKNKTTKRLLVEKDSDKNQVTSPTVQDLPTVDMGDYRNLVDFIRWGHENYPARHYFVVVWNHGTGWHKLALDGSPIQTWDISIDDLTKNAITTYQLGLAMEDASKIIGRKIDIYGSDACLMGMIEVAHQMKDSVQYFIGSEDLEPGDGWPYEQVLARWNSLSPATAEDIAKFLPEVYVASYKNESTTLSSYDLRHIDSLTTSLANLRAVMTNQNSSTKAALKGAVTSSLKFYKRDYVDLGDFLVKIGARAGIQQYMPQITSVQEELKKFVVANQTTGKFKQAQGLAIWLPSTAMQYTKYEKLYSELSFNISSQWHQLIEESL